MSVDENKSGDAPETLPETLNKFSGNEFSGNEFSRPIDVTTIGKNGRHFDFQATESEKSALARRYDILDIQKLTAKSVIKPAKKGQYNLQASYCVNLKQACSLSLETVEDEISGKFTVTLQHPPRESNKQSQNEDVEIAFDLDEGDIEYLNSNQVDAGELIAQYISLEINPYPRKPGAIGKVGGQKIIQEEDVDMVQKKKNPFAVLESLKHKT